MTTYFYRDPDGLQYSHVLPNVAPVYLATALVPGSALESYWQSMYNQPTSSSIGIEDGQNEYGYDTAENDEWHETDDGYHSTDTDNPPGASYVGDFFVDSVPPATKGNWPKLTQNGWKFPEYPDPELIRPHHTLLSLLPYLSPERLAGSRYGKKLNIVEEGTGHLFAVAVPKKMLVFFCGRNTISRFLRTLEREDNEHWQGGPVAQELQFPRHYVNHIGIKIVISWMHRACVTPTKAMRAIRIPTDTFLALSLSRALTAFGLHRDASRVDHVVALKHFSRGLDFDNIVTIWNCLPKDSKYVYRMVKDLRKRLDRYNHGDKTALPEAEQVLEYLEQQPALMHRVQDQEYNERREFRPFFGTEWCERAALRTQQMMSSLENMNTAEPRIQDEWECVLNAHKARGAKYRSGNRQDDKQQDHVQSQKRAVTLTQWERKKTPMAWPKFDKPIVVKVSKADTKVQSKSTGRKDSAYGSDGKSPE